MHRDEKRAHTWRFLEEHPDWYTVRFAVARLEHTEMWRRERAILGRALLWTAHTQCQIELEMA